MKPFHLTPALLRRRFEGKPAKNVLDELLRVELENVLSRTDCISHELGPFHPNPYPHRLLCLLHELGGLKGFCGSAAEDAPFCSDYVDEALVPCRCPTRNGGGPP